jgi:DNA-binding response OmpR family regulator
MKFIKTKSVLIVEDDPDIGLLLMYKLQKLDCRTYTASDGRTGLKMAFDLKPDLVLLDLLLPHLHGWEICRLIKQAPSTRNIPIIIFTALDSLANRTRSKYLGVEEYFTKDEHINDVLQKIRAILFVPSTGLV